MSATAATKAAPAKAKPSMKYVQLKREKNNFVPPKPSQIDRDESALHAVQLSLDGRGLLDNPYLILADIRDRNRMRELFCTLRPDVVFHAAV